MRAADMSSSSSSDPVVDVASTPMLSNGKAMKMRGFIQTSDWIKANIEVKASGSRSCMIMMPAVNVSGVLASPGETTRCPHPGWSSHTSTDSIAAHMEKVHGIKSPVVKRQKTSESVETTESICQHLTRVRHEASSVAKLQSAKLCFSSKDDCFALAFAMNPTHSLSVVDDPYWRVTFGDKLLECTTIKCSTSLRNYIISFDVRLEEQRVSTLKGVVGLQMDGGKDVNSRKIIANAYMHPSTRKSFVHRLLDTQLAVLDENWHKDNVISTVSDIMRHGHLFVPSITVDNEAAQNAGIHLAISSALPWVLHFRCGAHSIELLLNYLFTCLPERMHSDPCHVATQLVSKFRNTKSLSQALWALQRAANGAARPLVLVQACRTRKWSADYLVVARVLRLKQFLVTLFQSDEHHDALGQEPDWEAMSDFCKRAYPFYLCEQILQRDSSNAVHLAFFWSKCCIAARGLHDDVTAAVDRMIQDGQPRDQPQLVQISASMVKLKRKIDKRDEKMRSCKVFSLCSILWPSAVVVPGDAGWAQVERELHDFIEVSFPKWLEFREVVCLPSTCNAQAGYMVMYLQALRELTALVSTGQSATVDAAKMLFTRDVQAAERMFEDQGDSAPQPHPTSEAVRRNRRMDIYSSVVQSHWDTFKFSHPHAFFIFHILSHCCATEAGTERMFSSEKQIHSAIRQAMSPDLTEAYMRIRWNFEPLMQFLRLRRPDSEEHDVELVPFDE